MKTLAKLRKFVLLLIIFHSFSALFANFQNNPLKENVFRESIRSVQLFRDGWSLSYPVIDLNGKVNLVLKFDDLSTEIRDYHFRIIHCDSDWYPSSIAESEYIEGYFQNQIEDYEYSFNTYTNYIHYSLKIPNDDIRFILSGNYAIVVYEGFDEENIAFIKRFMVAEKIVGVETDIKRPVLSMYRNNSQQVNTSLQYSSLKIEDPFNDIRLVILQNGRWDNRNSDLKPLFDRNETLIYDYQSENLFPGGSEFRWFEIKSMRYLSPYIKSVEFENNRHHATLFPAENRANSNYFYDEDLNGKFYPEIQEEDNNDTEADYIEVSFELPMAAPMVDGNFYIFGALTNWLMNESNQMEYDFNTKSYKKTLLLKQGYYNYMFAFKAENGNIAEMQYTEGNHYETENDYIFLVYYKGSSSRYERLVGYQIANSLRE